MKKALTLLLCLSLTFGSSPLAFATTNIAAAGNPNNTGANIADDVNFDDAATLTIQGNFNINNGAASATEVVTAAVTNTTTGQGIITYDAGHNGTANIYGRVGITGSNGPISTINLDGTGTLNLFGDAAVNSGVVMSGNSTLSLVSGVDLTAGGGSAVSNDSGGATGTLTLQGTNTVTGTVGAAGVAALSIVNAGANGATATFANNVFATTLNVTGTGAVALNGNFTGTLDYDAAGTVTVADNRNITGAVTNSIGSAGGTLTLAGTTTVSSTVGAAGTGALSIVNAGAATDTATFSGNVFATTLNVTGTGNVALNGNFTGTLDYDAAGVVTLADDRNITGAVTNSSGAAAGTLTLAGTSTVSGQVGTSGTGALGTVNGGANGEVATFSSSIFASDLKVTGTGTVALQGDTTIANGIDFDGNGILTVANGVTVNNIITNSTDEFGTVTYLGASTIGSAIGTGGAADLLAVNINGGVVNLGANIAALTTTVNNGGTLTPTANRTLTGNAALATGGTISVGTNTLTVSGTYTQATGSTLNLTINNPTTFGLVNSAGNATVNAGSTVNVTLPSGAYIPNGTAFTVIDGNAGGGVNVPTITSSNSLVRFVGTGGNNLVLTAQTQALNSVSGSSDNSKGAGPALEAIVAGGSSQDMNDVYQELGKLSGDAAVGSALEQLVPDVSAGLLNGSYAAMDQFFGSIGSFLGTEVGAGTTTGVASGDALKGAGIWIQGFGNHARQGSRKGIEGYDVDVFGTAIGADILATQHFRLGTAFSYAFGDSDAKTATKNELHTHSYQGSLYSRYSLEHFFLDNIFGFGYNDYNSTRNISFAGVNRTAKADFGGQQYTYKILTGYTFDELLPSKFEVTPLASLQYTHLHVGKYTEKGAGALNLNVGSEGYNVLKQGLGAKLARPFEGKNGYKLVPSIRNMWTLDYIADRQETTSTFVAGGNSFTSRGAKPARNGFELGAELALLKGDHITISANYDLGLKDEYRSHTYFGTVRYEI